MSSQLEYQVTASDTDAGGIVYYVNYLKIIERAREAVFVQRGIDLALARAGCTLRVASCELKYIASAKQGQRLHISTDLSAVAETSFSLQQTVHFAEQELVRAQVTLACIEVSSSLECSLPDAVVDALATLGHLKC